MSGHTASHTPLSAMTSIASSVTGQGVGSSLSPSAAGRLSGHHTPTAADFQPPYFPPPYNIPTQQSLDYAAHAAAAAASDPYGTLTPLAPQQYHQLHPVTSQGRTQHMTLQNSGGGNGSGRRDETPDLQHLHNTSMNNSLGVPTSYSGTMGALSDHNHNHHHSSSLQAAAAVAAANRRANAEAAAAYAAASAGVRRPDVLMHSGHNATTLSEQDLLNLHHAGALSALEDVQVSKVLN